MAPTPIYMMAPPTSPGSLFYGQPKDQQIQGKHQNAHGALAQPGSANTLTTQSGMMHMITGCYGPTCQDP